MTGTPKGAEKAYLPYSAEALCPHCYKPLEIARGVDGLGRNTYFCKNCWASVLEKEEEPDARKSESD